MTDQATETEKALQQGKVSLLDDISKRQSGAATRDYLFIILVVVGVIVVATLAIAAAQYL